ncbi:hypothetical protein FACS189459_3770 [Bacilli bacterium]|nr:hypothetical protein FACS189459_3770 [Bacilli bacterium]
MYGIYINNDGKTFNGNTVNIYGTFNLKYGGSVESKDVFFIQICFQKTIATFAQETTLFIDGLFAATDNSKQCKGTRAAL